MSVKRFLVLAFGKLGIGLYALLEAYGLAFISASPVYLVALAIISKVHGHLPTKMNAHFMLVYLAVCIPLWICLFIIILIRAHKKSKEFKSPGQSEEPQE